MTDGSENQIEYNPYRYCTRCADELDDGMKKAYMEPNAPDVPLCIDCWNECLSALKESMRTAMTPIVKDIIEAFQPLIEVTENDRQ